jgi:alkylhydroperoxidase family enzyme
MGTARRSLSILPIAAVLCAAFPCSAASEQVPSTLPAMSSSGIPYVTDDQTRSSDLVEAIRARRPGGKLLNLDRMLLHSPNFAKGWNGMFAVIRNQLSVPAKLRELAIMAVGALNHADYEWAQHEGEYLKAGGTQAQLARLKDIRTAVKDVGLFDEAERATLALTSEMTRDVSVKRATMKRIRAVLPDDQVVELIGTIAGYSMVSRFVVATGVQVE